MRVAPENAGKAPTFDDSLVDELLEGSSGDDYSLGEHTPPRDRSQPPPAAAAAAAEGAGAGAGGGGGSAVGAASAWVATGVNSAAELQSYPPGGAEEEELVSHPPAETPWKEKGDGMAMETPMPGNIRCVGVRVYAWVRVVRGCMRDVKRNIHHRR